MVKQQASDLLELEIVQTSSGRVSKSKVISYLYQHAETEAIDFILACTEQYGHKPIARVHDAIFFRNSLVLMLKVKLSSLYNSAQEIPYWYLTPKQLKRYNSISIDQAVEEQLHRKRIADEELLAANYF